MGKNICKLKGLISEVYKELKQLNTAPSSKKKLKLKEEKRKEKKKKPVTQFKK